MLICQVLGFIYFGDDHANLAAGKVDDNDVELELNAAEDFLAQRDLHIGFGHEFALDNHADIVNVEETLRLAQCKNPS